MTMKMTVMMMMIWSQIGFCCPSCSRADGGAPPTAFVATVNVFVLVTSVEPLTSFLHDTAVVTTHLQQGGQLTQVTQLGCYLVVWLVAAVLTTAHFLPQLQHFLLQQLGLAGSQDALQQVRFVVNEVLRAALSTNEKQQPSSGSLPGRCVWCFQLLTFTLLLSPSHPSPVVIQVRQSCL